MHLVPFLMTSGWALTLTGYVVPPWKDPSPHEVRFREVAPAVRLEILDWGGAGPHLLLLAGHGDSAHVFDDCALQLVSKFRVLALTRRGFGASSQPQRGYDLATLVQDIARVITVLKIAPVHLVGHSIAGDEMTRFAGTYPQLLGKLVYLEAAYDRIEARRVEASFPKLPEPPSPLLSDLASPAALQRYLARTSVPMPESEIRHDKGVHPVGPVRPVGHAHADFSRGREHGRAPRLRSDSRSNVGDLRGSTNGRPTGSALPSPYRRGDQATRVALDRIFGIWQAAATAQRRGFAAAVPLARVVELKGASHYVFISHPRDVVDTMVAFLKSR